MSYAVRLTGVARRFGDVRALDGVDLDLRPGVITGLLGRNGSGKTTLASLLAGFRRPSAGQVLVDGEDPWENERLAPGICFVRESGDVLADWPAALTLRLHRDARPTFDDELAATLVETFGLDLRKAPGKMSRGQRSAFGIVLGLASRAPLTILDEVHLGLDAPSRYAFYDALLADYVEHPRTVVLSSHLIEEIERIVEDVVILDRGTVLLAQGADALRAAGVSVTGPTADVARFVGARPVLARRQLGGTTQVTVQGVPPDELDAARRAGLELGPVGLQDLFVHLTHPASVSREEES
jgi:ABC-2 type transport system ATP-binding protein